MHPAHPSGEPDPGAQPVTRLLDGIAEGDEAARQDLLELLYSELRAIASQVFSGQRADHTLQPTALVHEAYMRLVDTPGHYNNKHHFMAVAAKAMRQILINHARHKNAAKRGGERLTLSLDPNEAPLPESEVDVLELEEALVRLEAIDRDQARIVELRFFGGLTVEGTAQVMGVSSRTIKREWRMARAELLVLLGEDADDGGS